ncbi:DUF222 domain-containing protein [Microlunatus ginsengisoli]|uniref:DUF222 domain-containing protein n=1 Tax=Microlunatus ginsengisoli TaxID=363863 RepID=UPI003CD09196
MAELVADTHALAKLYECRRLVIAAAWADAHADPDDRPERAEDSQTSRRTRAENEGFVQPGGAGTPRIAETCPAELGVLQQLSVGSARCLIADALDLRHRLPRLWSRVAAGEVHAWKARQVATRSRHLGSVAAAEVDRLVCHQLELVSSARFDRILDAAMLHVDPVLYGRRAEESRTHRDVWVGEAERGLRTLIIRPGGGSVGRRGRRRSARGPRRPTPGLTDRSRPDPAPRPTGR